MEEEVSNFKTCCEVGFCNRHRYLASHLNGVISEGLRFDIGYEVEPGSLLVNEEGVKFLVRSVHETEWKLQGLLSVFDDEIVRFTVKEVETLWPRYQMPDEDLLSKDMRPSCFIEVTKHGEFAELSFKRLTVVLQFKPLRIDVVFDGVLATSLNHRGLFSFERYRKQVEAPPQRKDLGDLIEIVDASEVEYDVEGIRQQPNDLWQEDFHGFIDCKPRGPSSVAMDVCFFGTSQLYGLPERSDSINLADTRDGEPYRQFNLDVFMYKIDSRQALYGSIPFMLAKQGTRACGLFWNNPSNTYIDIETKGADKHTHWMSEAGVIDVFILPSDSALSLAAKFAMFTGPPAMPLLASLGFHQCRWNYEDQEDTLGVVSNFDRYHIPLDFIWLDIDHTVGRRYFTWDLKKFPDPKLMQHTIAEARRRLVVIIDPHIMRDLEYGVFFEAEGNGMATQLP